MRKKILTACAALTILTASALSANAVDIEGLVSPPNETTTDMKTTYRVDPTFTVVIPEKITLSRTDETVVPISVEDVNLPPETAIVARIENANQNYFHLISNNKYSFCLDVTNGSGIMGVSSTRLDYDLTVFRDLDNDPETAPTEHQILLRDAIEWFNEDGSIDLHFSPLYIYDNPETSYDDNFKFYAGEYDAVMVFGFKVEEMRMR